MTQFKPVNQQNQTLHRVVLLAADRGNSVMGEVVSGKSNRIAYSAYGEQSAQQDVDTNLAFNGQLRETNFGWYLLGNGYRAYNPRLMRFHSPDSWSPFGRGGLNPYMYCVGDPVNRSDPTGHGPLAPGLPLGLRKFVSRTDKFFFGGSGITGSNSDRAVKATAGLEAVAGPMRPERENALKAFGTLGTVVAGAPGAKAHPNSMNLDMGTTTSKTYPGYVGGAARDGLTNRPSHSIPRHAVSHPRSTTPIAQQLPPSYGEAMSLWNADTFAASQQPRTFTVNRMAVHREHNLGAAAPYQAPAGAPAPAAALVAEQNWALDGLAQLNAMQRDVIQHRVVSQNRRCRIL